MRHLAFFSFVFLSTFCLVPASFAQEPAESATTQVKPDDLKTADLTPEVEKLFADFTQLMHKSVMVGTFMIDADDNKKRIDERYEVSKVEKSATGDYWSFYARIKYGKHDVTLPIPVEIKWAGTTPVITVDNLTIPGMGTFDSRVLISDGKYAGTWRHGKVGGLMFGHLEKQDAEKEEVAKPAKVEGSTE